LTCHVPFLKELTLVDYWQNQGKLFKIHCDSDN
jgi:hypothetical protein